MEFRTPNDLHDLAPLYAIGSLDSEERDRFEAHLQECPDCRHDVREFSGVRGLLGLIASPAEPSPAVRDRLMNRIARRVEAKERKAQALKSRYPADGPPLYTVSSDDGEWQQFAPGIQVKRLAVDRETNLVTMLLKASAGARFPDHRHRGAEESFVIEGDLHIGDHIVLHAGDYMRAEAGTLHEAQHTVGGCTVLVHSFQVF